MRTVCVCRGSGGGGVLVRSEAHNMVKSRRDSFRFVYYRHASSSVLRMFRTRTENIEAHLMCVFSGTSQPSPACTAHSSSRVPWCPGAPPVCVPSLAAAERPSFPPQSAGSRAGDGRVASQSMTPCALPAQTKANVTPSLSLISCCLPLRTPPRWPCG